GTGSAIAASLAAVGVGTETDGSVTAPSAFAGLVGLKPTLGLVSRTHVIPISASQDTPGPMARSVLDAAILLTAMAGSDPHDPATAAADARRTDYAAALRGASLAGKRLGVLRYACKLRPATEAVFDAAIARLRAGGAEVLDVDFTPPDDLGKNEHTVLLTELKAGLNAYFATMPAAVKVHTLADLIAFNRASPRELALFGQELFEKAEATLGLGDPAYLKARADSLRAAGAEGIDRLLAADRLDALIAPTFGPAARIDVGGDHFWGGGATGMPAIAGYPHLTVPMGQVRGLPVGLSFIGPAWSDAAMLALGHAFEQAVQARRPPTYLPTLEDDAETVAAFTPFPAPSR
ncbi:MAG TPA: amidase family protein, partial [Caulobacteraceae bacterium]|nr:amidase family protein [Caulobacteraceae bacterium]